MRNYVILAATLVLVGAVVAVWLLTSTRIVTLVRWSGWVRNTDLVIYEN